MAKAKLTIGLVFDSSLDSTDGVPQYVICLGQWLSEQGHQVHYLVGQTKRTDLPNVHSLARNLSVKFNGNKTTIPYYANTKAVNEVLNSIKFDVLHIQVPYHPFLSAKIIKKADKSVAIIGTFHILPYGPMSSSGNRILGLWLKSSTKRFGAMLAVSKAAADFCKSSFKIDAYVIPNMIDVKRFTSINVKKRDTDVNILFLGRLVERKGAMTLLKALKLLETESDLPGYKLRICGKGAERSRLEQYVKDNKLSDKVSFAGFISEEDKPKYYASADIAVFPSKSGESFGIVLIEAMASGSSAVLAGNNPGYASVLESRPELLFDPYNPSELKNLLATYLRDQALRHSMAAWGKEFAANYDKDVVGPKIVNVYLEALLKLSEQ